MIFLTGPSLAFPIHHDPEKKMLKSFMQGVLATLWTSPYATTAVGLFVAFGPAVYLLNVQLGELVNNQTLELAHLARLAELSELHFRTQQVYLDDSFSQIRTLIREDSYLRSRPNVVPLFVSPPQTVTDLTRDFAFYLE
jgi:hypothetical protein